MNRGTALPDRDQQPQRSVERQHRTVDAASSTLAQGFRGAGRAESLVRAQHARGSAFRRPPDGGDDPHGDRGEAAGVHELVREARASPTTTPPPSGEQNARGDAKHRVDHQRGGEHPVALPALGERGDRPDRGGLGAADGEGDVGQERDHQPVQAELRELELPRQQRRDDEGRDERRRLSALLSERPARHPAREPVSHGLVCRATSRQSVLHRCGHRPDGEVPS